MKTQYFPVRDLTEAEEAVVNALEEKLDAHFDPQIEAQKEAVEAARGAAERAEQEFNANPRATELTSLFWRGDSATVKELHQTDPEKYRSLYHEWQALRSVVSDAKRAVTEAENELDDMESCRIWQGEHAMFATGKVLGRAEGVRLALAHLVPQLRTAGVNVTMTPELLTLLSATDADLLQEGGAIAC